MKLYTIQDKSKLKSVSNLKFDLEKDIHMSANNVHNLPKSEIRLK